MNFFILLFGSRLFWELVPKTTLRTQRVFKLCIRGNTPQRLKTLHFFEMLRFTIDSKLSFDTSTLIFRTNGLTCIYHSAVFSCPGFAPKFRKPKFEANPGKRGEHSNLENSKMGVSNLSKSNLNKALFSSKTQ